MFTANIEIEKEQMLENNLYCRAELLYEDQKKLENYTKFFLAPVENITKKN